MSRHVLVVATWGMPYGWRLVTYEINGFRCKTCTTLLPLLAWLRSEEFRDCEIHPSIIILDSVIDWRKQSSGTENPCHTCFERFGDILSRAANSFTYAELRQLVAEFTKKFVECVASETMCSVGGVEKRCSEVLGDVLRNLHIVVAPAIGRPGGVWSFVGRIQDYEVVVVRDLSTRFISSPYRAIVADLSHGINFMPSITARIIPRLASILLLAHRGVDFVSVRLYNSDPIPATASEDTVIRINEAVYTSIRSAEIVHSVAEKLVYAAREFGSIEAEFNRVLGGVVRKSLHAIRCIYTALYYPFPLALHIFLCRMCKDLDVVRDVDSYVVNSITIDHSKREIRRSLTIDSDTYYIYSLLKALCLRASAMCGEIEPSIDTLETELVPVYRLIHSSYEELIRHELSDIRRNVKALMQKPEHYKLRGSHITLAELHELLHSKEAREKREKRMNRRVMIAHAGLQKEFVTILIDETPRLRYVLSAEELAKELDSAGILIERTRIRRSTQ
jgi:CRISPR-associated protein Csx1